MNIAFSRYPDPRFPHASYWFGERVFPVLKVQSDKRSDASGKSGLPQELLVDLARFAPTLRATAVATGRRIEDGLDALGQLVVDARSVDHKLQR